MTTEKLIRWTGLSSMISGAIIFLAALTAAIAPNAVGTIVLIAGVFLLFALMGLYLCQIEETGILGLIGFVVAIAGAYISVGRFLPPSGTVIFWVGIILLAVATMRARVLPYWATWLLWLWAVAGLVSIVALVANSIVLLAIGLVLSSIARAGVGITLWFKEEKKSKK